MTDVVAPALPQTRVLALTRIQRERILPVHGEIIATIGGRVDPLDVIARSPGQGRLRPVPIARYMHLSETALPKHLLKQPGDDVSAREIIASKPEVMGTLRRIYRAPGKGRIASLYGVWMTLELGGAPVELKALYRGTVVNVMPPLGVVIEAVGSLAQGVWGAGGEGYGVLRKMVESADGILTEDKIDVSARGAVLLAGAGVTEQALRRAAQEQVAGIIVGSLAPALRPVVTTLGPAVLVTEGFGERPMCKPIYELLASHHGEETSLNYCSDRAGAERPEVFIPAISAVGAPLDAQPARPLVEEQGATVRVTGGPWAGAIGKLAALAPLPQPLESGISAWGAEVELAEGKQVFVPWHNLELIG